MSLFQDSGRKHLTCSMAKIGLAYQMKKLNKWLKLEQLTAHEVTA
jgi:hypothetical protein